MLFCDVTASKRTRFCVTSIALVFALSLAIFHAVSADEAIPPTVLKPQITVPDTVSNSVPIVRGERVPGQNSIIFCRDLKPCPSEGRIISQGTSFSFQQSLAPLKDGKNNFAFLAEKDGVYSEPVAFTVFYQSEASLAQSIVPQNLQDCISENLQVGTDNTYNTRQYGYDSTQPYRGLYQPQTQGLFSATPNDQFSSSSFESWANNVDERSTSAQSFSSSSDGFSGSFSPTQSFSNSVGFSSNVPAGTSGSPVGNITGAANYSGGSYPQDSIAASQTAGSRLLSGSHNFRFCLMQGGDYESQAVNAVTDYSTLQGNAFEDLDGYYDTDGNFVLSSEISGRVVYDSNGRPVGIDQNDDGITDVVFAGVGRGFSIVATPDSPVDSDGDGQADTTYADITPDPAASLPSSFSGVGSNYSDPPQPEIPECLNDYQCNSGQICRSAKCMDGCSVNYECNVPYEECQNDVCVVTKECLSDNDCGGRQYYCEYNTCHKHECLDNEDCDFGFLCHETKQKCQFDYVGPLLGVVGMLLRRYCPSYYLVEDGSEQYIANGLLAFTNRLKEKHDFVKLSSWPKDADVLTLRLKEEVKEVLYLNFLGIRLVQHDDDETVEVDQSGEFRALSDISEASEREVYGFEDYSILFSLSHSLLSIWPSIKDATHSDTPALAGRIQDLLSSVLISVKKRDAYEFELPSRDVRGILVSGSIKDDTKMWRFVTYDDLDASALDAFYKSLNACESCMRFMNDITEAIMTVHLEWFDESSNDWRRVPGSFVLEGGKRFISLPEDKNIQRIRIVTQRDAYAFDAFSFVSHTRPIPEEDIATIIPTKALPTIDHQEITGDEVLSLLANDDDKYLEIDKGDQVDLVFDLGLYNRSDGLSIFIDNKGYYEVGRSLKILNSK